jgi:hypothetical protein
MRRNTIFSRGISYIETIVWIAVFTSATIALGTSLVYYYHIAHYSIEQSSAVASVQHAIDTMVKTIREASYASDGAYPIVSLANNQIVFYAHTNAQSPYAQKVRYYVQGTALMQGVVEPSGDPPAYTNAEVVSKLADYVQNGVMGTTTFSYYDTNGALMSDLTQIGNVRFVKANVIVDVNTNDQPTQLTLRSSTSLRNLR